MGEFDFIRQYLQRQQSGAEVVLGIGDDAAIVRPLPGLDWCISTDMLLAGRHFFADEAAADIAYKVLAVNLSDMAAMGAQPRWALLSAALPALNPAWLGSFCDSLFALAAAHGVTLIGGDTTRGDYVFNITIGGTVPQGQGLRRSGAQVGDDIWLSGQVGLAAAALQQRLGHLRLPEAVFAECNQALLRPTPRVALGQALLGVASAALDVSDGVAQDLQHILRACGVGADINTAQLPTLAALRQGLPEAVLLPLLLAGGDDYELLFTAAPAQRAAVAAAGIASGTALSRIGTITDQRAVLRCLDASGHSLKLDQQGYDHFG